MKPIDYFKKTFVFAFFFTIVYKLVYQIFEGFSTITPKFLLKVLLIALTTALILATLNCFFKIDFIKKRTTK